MTPLLRTTFSSLDSHRKSWAASQCLQAATQRCGYRNSRKLLKCPASHNPIERIDHQANIGIRESLKESQKAFDILNKLELAILAILKSDRKIQAKHHVVLGKDLGDLFDSLAKNIKILVKRQPVRSCRHTQETSSSGRLPCNFDSEW